MGKKRGWSQQGGKSKDDKGASNTQSARGKKCILGTCDAAREKEANKELLNILTQIIEEEYPNLDVNATEEDVEDAEPASKVDSVADALAKEIADLKGSSGKAKQPIMSVRTDIKGLIFIKLMAPALCPLHLVNSIFRKVQRDQQPLSRYIFRLFPLQRVFYPTPEELTSNLADMVTAELSTLMSSEVPPESNDEPVSKKQRSDTEQLPRTVQRIPYAILFNRRNHDVLRREAVHTMVMEAMPKSHTASPRNPQAAVIVEAFRNICGLSFVANYSNFHEFNLRKYQTALLAPPNDADAGVTKEKEEDNDINDDRCLFL